MAKLTLNAKDFFDLVSGNPACDQIILADIGFDTMRRLIDAAESADRYSHHRPVLAQIDEPPANTVAEETDDDLEDVKADPPAEDDKPIPGQWTLQMYNSVRQHWINLRGDDRRESLIDYASRLESKQGYGRLRTVSPDGQLIMVDAKVVSQQDDAGTVFFVETRNGKQWNRTAGVNTLADARNLVRRVMDEQWLPSSAVRIIERDPVSGERELTLV